MTDHVCAACNHHAETHFDAGTLASAPNSGGGCVARHPVDGDRCACTGYVTPPAVLFGPKPPCARCGYPWAVHNAHLDAFGTITFRRFDLEADLDCTAYTDRVPPEHRIDRTSPTCECGHGANSHVGITRCTARTDLAANEGDRWLAARGFRPKPCTCPRYSPRRAYRVALAATTGGLGEWFGPPIRTELWLVTDPDGVLVAFALGLPEAHRVATALGELDADEADPGPSGNHPAARPMSTVEAADRLDAAHRNAVAAHRKAADAAADPIRRGLRAVTAVYDEAFGPITAVADTTGPMTLADMFALRESGALFASGDGPVMSTTVGAHSAAAAIAITPAKYGGHYPITDEERDAEPYAYTANEQAAMRPEGLR